MVTQTRGQQWLDRVAEIVLVLIRSGRSNARPPWPLRSSDLRITLIDAGQVASHAPRGQFQAAIAARLGADREVRAQGMGMGGGMGRKHGDGPGARAGNPARSVDVRLNDGQWIRVVATAEQETPPLPTEYWVYLALSLFVVSGIVLLAVRQATRPLQQLAQAADAFGNNLDAAATETGPSETRRAAQAFNRMQGRIRRLVGGTLARAGRRSRTSCAHR